MDLIRLLDNEQVYTNILYSILMENNLFAQFCQKFKDPTACLDNNIFEVFRETKVINGRMDVCAESKNQRIVIENKVYSGLNGLKSEDNITQLSTYYQWAKEKRIEPLCFVIVPDFRLDEIRNEIRKYDSDMENIYKIVTYGNMAEFIEDNLKNIPNNYIYYDLVKQIIAAFNNLSYKSKEDYYANLFYMATI